MPFWTHIQILHLHILFYSQVYTDNDNFLLTDMDNLILKALGNLRIYRQMLWRCRLHLHLAYIIIFEVLFDALDILSFIPRSGISERYTSQYVVRGKKNSKERICCCCSFLSHLYLWGNDILGCRAIYFHPAYRISSFMILRIYYSLMQNPLKPQHEKKHSISEASVTTLASLETKTTNNKIHWSTSISFSKLKKKKRVLIIGCTP